MNIAERYLSRGNHTEFLRPEETEPVRDVSIIAVTGDISTGKTTVTDVLAARFGIKKVLHPGKMFREVHEQQVLGYVDRELAFDQAMDQLQLDEYKKATLESPVISDGHLSGVLLADLREDLETRQELTDDQSSIDQDPPLFNAISVLLE